MKRLPQGIAHLTPKKQAGLPARGQGESLQKGTCKMSSAT